MRSLSAENRFGGIGRRLLALAVCLALAGCSTARQAAATEDLVDAGLVNAANPNYTLVSLEQREVTREFTSMGNYEFPAYQPLFFEEEGRLLQIHVTNNSQVTQGDLLAELEYDQGEVNAEIALLEAAIQRREEKLLLDKEAHRLAVSGLNQQLSRSVEKVDRDVLKLRLEQQALLLEQMEAVYGREMAELERKLAEERKRRGVMELRAPYDGFINGVRGFSIGSKIAAKEILMSLYDTSACMLKISADRRQFCTNMPVDIFISKTETVPGVVVSSPSDKVSESSSQFLIKPLEEIPISLSSIGRTMSVVSKFSLTTWLLPSRAVTKEDGKEFVSILEDGVVKRRYVKTGFTNMQEVEILYGLDGDERIVMIRG